MLTKGMKRALEKFVMNECDDIVVDIISKKLKWEIDRDGDFIVFKVEFAGHEIANDRINIK